MYCQIIINRKKSEIFIFDIKNSKFIISKCFNITSNIITVISKNYLNNNNRETNSFQLIIKYRIRKNENPKSHLVFIRYHGYKNFQIFPSMVM